MAEPNRARAWELEEQYRAAGDPTGWFEALYREHEQGHQVVPWADRGPSPSLLEFFESHPMAGAGKTALTVGCGYGDDAEQLAQRGFRTTAFDISPSAIEACRRRYPHGAVDYVAADLFNPPVAWAGRFDLVLESNTLQALPQELRVQAIRGVAGFVKEGGNVLVIARGRDEEDEAARMPWPLTRRELGEFLSLGLREESFEDYFDRESPPVRRFRAVYAK